MTEEKQEIVQENAPEALTEIQSTQETVEDTSAQETKEVPRKDVDYNWKQVNELLALQKKRIEELEIEKTSRQVQKPIVEEEDEFSKLDQDDYLTVGKARNLAEKLAEKKAKEAAKQIVEQYMREQNVQNDEQRVRSKYEDYDYVVENFAVPLIKNDPALAHKVMNSKNPAETAYKLGKLSDAYEDQSNKQTTSPRAEKILKNTSRPISSNAATSPSKGRTEDYSKMSKEEVWKMAEKYAKGAI